MRSSSSSRTRFVSFHSFRAFWHFANKKKKKEEAHNDDNGEETVKQEQQKQKGEKKNSCVRCTVEQE